MLCSVDPERTKSVLAWAGNVSSSVLIVFCNKVLMGNTGYKFHFATSLSALHFLVCSMTLLLQQGGSPGKCARLPMKELLIFTAVADVSIISLNLSLLLNDVSTYQIAKLLVIPFVCLVEGMFCGSRFSAETIATIALVVLGVGIVTVEDVSFDSTPLGLLMAAGSVVASGMQQILCRSLQKAHGLSPNELLANLAPAQAVSLLLLGPLVDKLVTSDWVVHYHWTRAAGYVILLSCTLAISVNMTQFMCLGRFSAVSFQVLGHTKTILVLVGSWLFLGESASPKKIGGMALAVVGMVLYGTVSMQQPVKQPEVVAEECGGKGKDMELRGLQGVEVADEKLGAQEDEPLLHHRSQPYTSPAVPSSRKLEAAVAAG